MATSFTILSSADILRQICLEKPSCSTQTASGWSIADFANWDPVRTSKMSLWGLTGHPLTIHFWMNTMERWQGTLNMATASRMQVLQMAGRKVIIDQLTASPVFLGSFLMFAQLMDGHGLAGCQLKLERDWWTMVKGGWSCWVIGHLISFSVVPVHWRVLYINVVSIGFGTFMSKMMVADAQSGAIETPVDRVWQLTSGAPPGAEFGSTSFGAMLTTSAWCAAVGSLYMVRTHVGTTGMVCGSIGLSMALVESMLSLRIVDLSPSIATHAIAAKTDSGLCPEQTIMSTASEERSRK
eukprot:SAG31_NODE_4799_length_2952_cov_2.405889_2_plen_296_part_00